MYFYRLSFDSNPSFELIIFNINWNVCGFKGVVIHLIQKLSHIQLLVLAENVNLWKIKEKKKQPVTGKSKAESQTRNLTEGTCSD